MAEMTYGGLVAARKACNLCSTLTNASVIADGEFDSTEIGPYARWQGNLNADVLIVAQDFADVDTFVKVRGWPGERVQTNLLLAELLNAAGIGAKPPQRGAPDDTVFCTNAILCMKQGGMQARVPDSYFANCGRAFLRPTIELVAPRAVVALGGGALKAVRAAYGVPEVAPLARLADATPAAYISAETALFVRFHPSPTVTNTHRPKPLQIADWVRLGEWLQS